MRDSDVNRATEAKLNAIEKAIRDLYRMAGQMISKEQFNRINAIRQRDYSLLKDRVETLEASLTEIEGKYDSLL